MEGPPEKGAKTRCFMDAYTRGSLPSTRTTHYHQADYRSWRKLSRPMVEHPLVASPSQGAWMDDCRCAKGWVMCGWGMSVECDGGGEGGR